MQKLFETLLGQGSRATRSTAPRYDESTPGPRQPPESSPPLPGGSSSASNHRASRPSAGAAVSRAGSVAWYGATAVLVAFAALFALPLQARAQTVSVLVSNVEQPHYAGHSVSFLFTVAQGFTTGSSAAALHSVTLASLESVDEGESMVVSLHSDSSGFPGTSLGTFTAPATMENNGDAIFTVPSGTTISLAADTDYFVHIAPGTGNISVSATTSTAEDATGTAGASLANRLQTSVFGGAFTEHSSDRAIRLSINTATPDETAPSLSAATVDGSSLVLTYDEDLDEASEPAASAYSVSINSGTGGAPSSVDVSGKTVTLALSTPVVSQNSVTVSYTVPSSNPVQDEAGNDAAALTDQSVTNSTESNNNAATGKPTISGVWQVGHTLTASTDDIVDEDGIPNTFTYQWIRVDADGISNATDITDAASSTYTLSAGDEGRKVMVEVSFTDEANNDEELTSDDYPSTGTIVAQEGDCPSDSDWCTTLIVGAATFTGFTSYGFHSDPGGTTPPYGELNDTSINYGATSLDIYGLIFRDDDSGNDRLVFAGETNTERVPHGTVINLDGTDYTADATSETGCCAYQWTPPSGFGWIEGQKVTVGVNLPNLAARGAPTISGPAQLGFTLTASTDEIQDDDGLANASYSYQWIRFDGSDEEEIPGATSSTYTLVAADVDKQIKVKVSFTDDAGIAEGPLTSEAYPRFRSVKSTPKASFGAPVYEVEEGALVAIRMQMEPHFEPGTPDVTISILATGQNGAVASDDFSGVPISFTLAPGTPWVTFQVRAIDDMDDDDGESILLTFGTLPSSVELGTQSQTTINIVDNDNTPATGRPSISGTAQVGQTLTAATTGIADVDGLTSPTYGYQWIRVDGDGASNPADIADATSGTYTPVTADVGKKLRVRVRFTDDDNHDEELTSDAYPASGTVEAMTNVSPLFTSPTTFDAAENQTAVGTVQASDDNAGDNVTGYAIQGGADASTFSIVPSTGVLTFAAAPNFEAPADADADNGYVVVVRAASGTGARVKTADQTITVTVTDVDSEVPGVPAVPTVSAASESSVMASWTAPATAGPAITDYDYRYRVKTPQGSWTEVTGTTITALSATITGLAEDTEYDVQVRATNDEGTSGWSLSGSGSTDAPDNTPATGRPTISGVAQVDSLLTAGKGTIADVNGTTKADNGDSGYAYTYQWIRVDGGTKTNISGATSNTYTPVDDDEGKKIKVRVSFQDDADHSESRTSAATATVTGNGNEPALSIADASAAENDGHLLFEVTLSRSLRNTVKVDFETISGGTATEGVDYWPRDYTHVIPAGETTVQMGFALIEDTVADAGETVKVRLSNARVVNAYGDKIKDLDITTAEATGTITAPTTTTTTTNVPGLTIRIQDATGSEDSGWLLFKVKLSRKYDDYVCYDFETISGGTATEGTDYLKFPKATYWMQIGKTVDKPFVRIIDDRVDEPDETVKVKISNAHLCNDASQTLSITRAEAIGTISETGASGMDSSDDGDGDDALLARVGDVTPEAATAALFGGDALTGDQLAAMDQLGNRNGAYDLGDLLSWRARCHRNEVSCGAIVSATDAGSVPASPAMPPTKRNGRTPPRRRRGARAGRRSGRNMGGSVERVPQRRAMRSGAAERGPGGHGPAVRRATGWIRALALGLVASAWGCGIGDNPVQPAQPDPGPLHVQLTVPPEARDIGAMLVVEGPGIDSLSAPGFELIQADEASSNRREAIIAGSLSTGPVLQVWVPDRRQLADYRVTLMQVSGDDYGLEDLTQYGIAISR